MYEQEIGELKSILGSRALRNLLNEHKVFWQNKVNECIRQQNLIEAYGAIAKFDDLDKILGLIQLRIKKMEEEK